MTIKFALTAFLYVCATALFIASAATNVLKYETRTRKIEFGYFWQCMTVGTTVTCDDPTSTCEKFTDMFNAGKGFVILSCIVTGLLALTLLVRVRAPPAFLPLGAVFVVGGLLAIASGLITWGVAFAAYQAEFCGKLYKNDPNVDVGASGPLSFVAWCLVVIAWLAELIMDSVPDPNAVPISQAAKRTFKFWSTLVLYVCATGVLIASSATALLRYSNSNSLIEVGFFETFGDVAGMRSTLKSASLCSDFNEVLMAGQAFVIISCVVLGSLAVAAGMRLWWPLVCANLGCVFTVGSVLAVGSTLVTWGVVFALYDAEFCSKRVKYDGTSQIGAAGPLAFIGFCLVIFVCLFELAISSSEEEPAAPSKTAPDSAPAAIAATAETTEKADEKKDEEKPASQ